MGGENPDRASPRATHRGSSPRGRGKLDGVCDELTASGLIPAWAGKTRSPGPRVRGAWAHPRVGGENPWHARSVRCDHGSSPRGRGKRSEGVRGRERWGLIPAWAGKTSPTPHPAHALAAHPRVGGENGTKAFGTHVHGGSSPRGRGKRLHGDMLHPPTGSSPRRILGVVATHAMP